MEGMIPAILARRGAKSVTAIDVTLQHADKITSVKNALGFDFDLIAPVFLTQAPSRLKEAGIPAFDVVIFSGVLYHTLDIAASLAAVRAMVRTGGLVVVESWITKGTEVAAYFNDHGRYTAEGNTFWFLTVGALDYLLRFFCLKPLDCAYFECSDRHNTIRLATVCQAVAEPFAGDDHWMREAAIRGVDAQLATSLRLPHDRSDELRYEAVHGAAFSLPWYVENRKAETATAADAVLWLADRA
jgi:hypothetical protein